MLAFSIDYYGMIFRATQSVELFCAYDKPKDLPVGVQLKGTITFTITNGGK